MIYELSSHSEQRIQAELNSGRFGSVDEVVQAALTALEELRTRHQELQAELMRRAEKAKQGGARPFDLEEFLASMQQRLPTNP